MLKSSLLLAALLLPVFSAANAEDYKAGDLEVSNPWSQELPPSGSASWRRATAGA